jgi:hypothetical protein
LLRSLLYILKLLNFCSRQPGLWHRPKASNICWMGERMSKTCLFCKKPPICRKNPINMDPDMLKLIILHSENPSWRLIQSFSDDFCYCCVISGATYNLSVIGSEQNRAQTPFTRIFTQSMNIHVL